MSEPRNEIEILTRFIRGERPMPTPPRSSFTGPLLQALESSLQLESSLLPATQHTHSTVAVMALAQLVTEFAEKADGPNGKLEGYRRIGEMIQQLPLQQIHKSLDSIFRDWKASTKGSSRGS